MLIRTSAGDFEAFDSTYEEDLFSCDEQLVYAVDKESLLIYRQATADPKEGGISPWTRYGSGRDDKGYLPRCSSYAAKQLRKKLAETGEWPVA